MTFMSWFKTLAIVMSSILVENWHDYCKRVLSIVMSSIFWHDYCKGLTLHSYVKYIGSTNFGCSGAPSEPVRMRIKETPNSFGVKGKFGGRASSVCNVSKVRALASE